MRAPRQVQKLQDLISEKREQMVADMIEMSSIPAVNPKMGGTGEYARMQWIMRWFDKRQIPYEVYQPAGQVCDRLQPQRM